MPGNQRAIWNWQRAGLALLQEQYEAAWTPVLAVLYARGLLRASTLRAGGQLLAVWLGAVYQQRWSGWVFAFNPKPAFNRFSLGRQLLYPMLQESHRAGHAEFDFSIGMEFYKLNFATHVRPMGLAGHPPVSERATTAVKQLLRTSPWCYEKAKAVRQWLAHSPAPLR